MAVVVIGKSICPICHETIREGDEIVYFSPARLPDEFAFLSDAGVHRGCLESASYGARALAEHDAGLRDLAAFHSRKAPVLRRLRGTSPPDSAQVVWDIAAETGIDAVEVHAVLNSAEDAGMLVRQPSQAPPDPTTGRRAELLRLTKRGEEFVAGEDE